MINSISYESISLDRAFPSSPNSGRSGSKVVEGRQKGRREQPAMLEFHPAGRGEGRAWLGFLACPPTRADGQIVDFFPLR